MTPGQRIADIAVDFPGPIAGQYGRSAASGAWIACAPNGERIALSFVTAFPDGTISVAGPITAGGWAGTLTRGMWS